MEGAGHGWSTARQVRWAILGAGRTQPDADVAETITEPKRSSPTNSFCAGHNLSEVPHSPTHGSNGDGKFSEERWPTSAGIRGVYAHAIWTGGSTVRERKTGWWLQSQPWWPRGRGTSATFTGGWRRAPHGTHTMNSGPHRSVAEQAYARATPEKEWAIKAGWSGPKR
jgi:hypothetical protein